MTYEGRYNTAPAWSPRNDMIAFVGRADEDRSLGVYMIRPDGGGQTHLGGGGFPDAPRMGAQWSFCDVHQHAGWFSAALYDARRWPSELPAPR